MESAYAVDLAHNMNIWCVWLKLSDSCICIDGPPLIVLMDLITHELNEDCILLKLTSDNIFEDE